MRKSQISEWYVIKWGQPIVASTTIEGIRLEGTILSASAMIPHAWFSRTKKHELRLLFQMGIFETYTPTDDDELLLYTVYGATRPDVEFDSQHSGRTKWYRVSNDAPYGITALITIDGICKAGDTAMAGDVIPSQWLSALSSATINRMIDSGVSSVSWAHEHLTSQQQQMLDRHVSGVIDPYKPFGAHLDALYEKYPTLNPDNKVNKDE